MQSYNDFQNIILKIATELINIKNGEFNQKIDEVLHLVGSFLNVDRAYVFEYDHDKRVTNNTHEWTYQGVSKQIDELQNIPMDIIQDVWVKKHLEGKAVIIEYVSQLDNEHPLYQILVPQGIQSVTTLPMMTDQGCIGFVGFDDVRTERNWNQTEMSLLKVLTEVITNALLKETYHKKLIELKDKADHASQEKNQFLAKMSHEFRTPLHGISNAIYLLNATRLNHEQKEYLDIADFSAQSLTKMIDEILDISKIESGDVSVLKEAFDLESEMVNIILSEQSIAFEKGLTLIFDYDYDIDHHLIGDYPKLRQIILNLLNNAIKFTKQGIIKIKVQQKTSNVNDVVIHFEISDTGIGIDQPYMNKIFDKFYQIDTGDSRKYEGTGLGLSIVKEFIESMGSEIHVSSHLGKGSVFTFDLVFKKDKSYDFDETRGLQALITDHNAYTERLKVMFESMDIHVDFEVKETQKIYDIIVFNTNKSFEMIQFYKNNFTHSKSIMIATGDIEQINHKDVDIYFNQIISRKNIYFKIISMLNEKKQYEADVFHKALSGYALIVDDNRLNRIALENIIKKQGLKSKMVDSGIKAIEAAKQERFDIILMDIQMPEMDGIEASKKIRALGPQYKYLPIIALTANAFLNDYDLMKHAQIDDVLFKPIHMDALERTLRKHLSYRKQIFVPAMYKVFDQQDYEYRFDDSYEISKVVIKTFIETYKDDLIKIKDAIESGEKKQMREALHYFKGSCSYLSGTRATWLITKMMEMTDQSQKDVILSAYEVLVYEVDKLLELLKKYEETLK